MPLLLHTPLAQADPAFRRKLLRAANLMQAGALVNGLAVGVGAASYLAILVPALSMAGLFVNLALSLVGVAFTSSGWWALAAPEPGSSIRSASRTWVRLAQVLPIVPCVILLAALLVFLKNMDDLMTPLWIALPGMVLLIILPAIGFFAGTSYLRLLARRLDDPVLNDRITIMSWVVPLCMTVGACLVVGPIGASIATWRTFARFKASLQAIDNPTPTQNAKSAA